MTRAVLRRACRSALILSLVCSAAAQAQTREPLEGVAFDRYVARWPALQECVTLLNKNDRRAATYCVDGLIHNGTSAGGASNLKAQLLREEGKLDEADKAIDRAVALEENEALHYFQRAQIALTRVTLTSNPISKWTGANAAYAAFEKALAIDPKGYPYRQYIVISKLRSPMFAGGDKPGALAMAEEGIALGCQACYMLRGYARITLEQFDPGFADFDKAVTLGVLDTTLFLRAGQSAIDRKDWSRAERYYRYIVSQRPKSARAHTALGGFFAKKGDTAKAAEAFQAALAIDPDYRQASDQLAAMRQGR